MEAGDRRSSQRCPVCQGPFKADPAGGEGKCRNSVCNYNHRHAMCPRCGENELESVRFEGGVFHYTCNSCKAKWKS
jgi:hypothetical protein